MSGKKAADEAGADVVELEAAPEPPPVVTPQPLVPVHVSAADAGVAPPVRSEDLFAQLSTALTMKMNPPPDPRVDLRLSTGLWLLTTVVGVGMWVYFSLRNVDRLTLIWFVAGVQVVLGLGWIVYRAGCRGPVAGLVALFPPVTVYRLFQPDGPDGYRPLRFVLTAAVLAVLPYVPIPSRAAVGTTLGLTDPTGLKDEPAESPLAHFRQIAERPGGTEPLRAELRRLAATGRDSASDPDAAAMVAEFRKLLKTDSPAVRGDAIRALVAWDPDAARADVTRLLQYPFQNDRETALALLKTWPDRTSAQVAVGRLAADDDQLAAKNALLDIGKVAPEVVEAVALDALLNPAEQNAAPPKPLLEVLEAVGGDAAVAGLKTYVTQTSDLILKDRAKTTLDSIERRLAGKPGGKVPPKR